MQFFSWKMKCRIEREREEGEGEKKSERERVTEKNEWKCVKQLDIQWYCIWQVAIVSIGFQTDFISPVYTLTYYVLSIQYVWMYYLFHDCVNFSLGSPVFRIYSTVFYSYTSLCTLTKKKTVFILYFHQFNNYTNLIINYVVRYTVSIPHVFYDSYFNTFWIEVCFFS